MSRDASILSSPDPVARVLPARKVLQQIDTDVLLSLGIELGLVTSRATKAYYILPKVEAFRKSGDLQNHVLAHLRDLCDRLHVIAPLHAEKADLQKVLNLHLGKIRNLHADIIEAWVRTNSQSLYAVSKSDKKFLANVVDMMDDHSEISTLRLGADVSNDSGEDVDYRGLRDNKVVRIIPQNVPSHKNSSKQESDAFRILREIEYERSSNSFTETRVASPATRNIAPLTAHIEQGRYLFPISPRTIPVSVTDGSNVATKRCIPLTRKHRDDTPPTKDCQTLDAPEKYSTPSEGVRVAVSDLSFANEAGKFSIPMGASARGLAPSLSDTPKGAQTVSPARLTPLDPPFEQEQHYHLMPREGTPEFQLLLQRQKRTIHDSDVQARTPVTASAIQHRHGREGLAVPLPPIPTAGTPVSIKIEPFERAPVFASDNRKPTLDTACRPAVKTANITETVVGPDRVARQSLTHPRLHSDITCPTESVESLVVDRPRQKSCVEASSSTSSPLADWSAFNAQLDEICAQAKCSRPRVSNAIREALAEKVHALAVEFEKALLAAIEDQAPNKH